MFSTRRRQLAWLLGLAVVLAIGALSLGQQRRSAAAAAAVHDALQVRELISDTLSSLKDAETGQRGYLLTRDEAFLAPYENARRSLPEQLGSLAALVGGDPEQLASALTIERLSREKLDELASTIALSRKAQLEEALRLVREGRGRRLMVTLREESRRMLDRQAEQLRQREQHAADGRLQLSGLLLGSTGLFLCFVVWGLWSASRGVGEARRAKQRLRENEATLRLVTDNATDLVRVIGPESELTYVSPSCQALLQYSPAEMFAMAPRALMHPDEREAALQLTRRVQSGEPGTAPFVHRLRSKDGAYRWFETTYRLVQGGDEQAPHIHLTSRDITARRSAEDALRRQTARLRSIVESMGDGVVVLDPDRRLAIVNPVANAYIHQSEGEIVPDDWSQRHHVFTSDGATHFPVDQSPLLRALGGASSSGTEVVIRDRRGYMRTFSVTAGPILEGDVIAGAVGVFHDITEQRLAEKDLLESEQRLRVLAEATFEGVVISRSGITIDTNQTFASWVGREPYELIGVHGLSLFAPEDHALVLEKSAQAGVYEATMLRKSGERFPVEVRGRHATFRGDTVRIAVIRDITDRRQREEELKRQAELLRSMSLRDELTGLLNRRGFQEHARQQLRLSGRTRRAATVFFLDLNGMKVINDTFGHEAGDAALVETATILTKAFRESDIVARLGGDEFAVLASDCDADGARALRERIAQYVLAFNQGARELPFRLSMSVGTAIFDPQAPLELDTLLENADHAMYEDKRTHAESRAASRSRSRVVV